MSSSSPAAARQCLESPVSRPSGVFQTPARQTLLCCLLLTVVVLLSYNPVTHNGFIQYDDEEYITDNPHVRAGLTLETLKWAFTTYYEANWAPLSWLSHALDCELFGLNPSGPHYESVLFHAANAVLLFLFLQGVTGFRGRSLMVAALFALHPINVESVAWAAERKNVLSMLFFLLALHAYVWYVRKPALVRYAVVFFMFALGLLSKSQVITLPFLLLLLDYWPLCRIGVSTIDSAGGEPSNGSGWRWGWLVLEKAPLFALSAASAVITMRAEKAGGAVLAVSPYSLSLRLETAVISYARYLGKALWPSQLVGFYPHPTRLYPVWQVAAACGLLILVTAVVLRAPRRRYLLVGWFWFLGTLVPMIGLVQVGRHAMADRFAYIPFIGLFLILVWLAADFAGDWHVSKRGLALPAILGLLTLGSLTYRQVGYWHDTPSFWQRTLALTQGNYVAEDNLGHFLFTQDRREEAAAHFRAALAIEPDDLPATLNLGAYEHGRGNLQEAIERYKKVAQYAGDVRLRATAYGNLGSAYRQAGDLVSAKQSYEIALQLDPQLTMAMVGLGLIAQENGDWAESVHRYSTAAAMQPTEVAYLLLAQALQQAGRLDEAKAIYERVVRSPNFSEAKKEAQSLLSRK